MKRKKGGVKAPLLPKLGDVAHLHPKATKKKKLKLPLCWNLATTPLVPKSNKIENQKLKKREHKLPPYAKTLWWHPLTLKATKQKKKGSRSSSFVDTWWWCPIMPISNQKKGDSNCVKTWWWHPPAPRNNKKKRKKRKKGRAKAPPLSRLGNGAHLHLEEKKPKKGRKEGVQASLLPRLSHGALEATKKWKKREQAPSLLNLCNGVLKTTNKNKRKEEASSPSVESWWWCHKSNKKEWKKGELSSCSTKT